MANLIYKKDGTAIVWAPASQTPDATWEVDTLASGAGRQGALYDLGVGTTARARRYMWRFVTQCQATPTVGLPVRLYLKTSDGTNPDNDDGTGDAAVSAEDKLRNLVQIGVCIVDEAAANIPFVAHGEVLINERYVAPVAWNATGATLTTDETEHSFTLTPVPDEIQ